MPNYYNLFFHFVDSKLMLTMKKAFQYDQLKLSALNSRPVVRLKPLDWNADMEIVSNVDNSPNSTTPSKRIKIEPHDILCADFPTQAGKW